MSFNNFDILSQYFPKESNELKDKNKFPLLVLDNYYLPFFTDWAIHENDGKLLQFLFEADKFRFSQPNICAKDLIDHLSDLNCNYIQYIQTVLELDKENIDMPAALACLCNYVWDLFLTKAQRIHQSSIWPSFYKKIIEGYQLDLYFVITDDHYSGYFKQYLLHTPGDAESLSCWRDVRHVLYALQILKKPNVEPSNNLSNKKPPLLTTSSNSSGSGSNHNLSNYPQPYEPLSVLLECLRKHYNIIIRGVCNGISQATKIKLADLYQQTNSIRNVKSLDLKYAADCCESIESVLSILMGECYQYLQEKYYQYLKSHEYVAIIASIRLKNSETVQKYLQKNVFLQEISDGKRFARRLTGNTIYLRYPFELKSYQVLSSKISIFSLKNQFENNNNNSQDQKQKNIQNVQDNFTTNIIPFLVFRSDYSIKPFSNEIPTLTSVIKNTSCWIGEHQTQININKVSNEKIFVVNQKSPSCSPNHLNSPSSPTPISSTSSRTVSPTSSSPLTTPSSPLVSTPTQSQLKSELESSSSSLICNLIHEISYPNDYIYRLYSTTPNQKKKSEKKKKRVTFQLDNELNDLNDLNENSSNVKNSQNYLDQKQKDELNELDKNIIELIEECHNNCLHTESQFTLNEILSPDFSLLSSTPSIFFRRNQNLSRLYYLICQRIHNDLKYNELILNESITTHFYIGISLTKKYQKQTLNDEVSEFISIVYVVSPLPIIDTIDTICNIIHQSIDYKSNININSYSNGNSTDNNNNNNNNNNNEIQNGIQNGNHTKENIETQNEFQNKSQNESQNESIIIPLTNFQNKIWNLNMNTIYYTLTTPYHREKIVEFFINQPVDEYSKSSHIVCDFSLSDLFELLSFNLFLIIMLKVISKRSIIIHSINSQLIVKVFAAIESLIHPLEIVDINFCQYNSTIEKFRDWKENYLLQDNKSKNSSFMMGLSSDIAATIIKFQTDREQSDSLLMESMNLDVSFGKFLQDTNFNDLQLLDLHDIEFIDLDTERIWSSWNPSGTVSSTSFYDLTDILRNIIFHITEETKNNNDKNNVDKIYNNFIYEKYIKLFWYNLYLKHIPVTLAHYPQYCVVSCNITTLIQSIFQTDQIENNQINRKKMDFIESLIDSKEFELLLQRFGVALDYWEKKIR